MNAKEEFKKRDSEMRRSLWLEQERANQSKKCPCCGVSYSNGESFDGESTMTMVGGVYECGRCFSLFDIDYTCEGNTRLLTQDELLDVYNNNDMSNQLHWHKFYWAGPKSEIDPYKDFYNYKIKRDYSEISELKELRDLLIRFGVDPAVTGLDFSDVEYFEKDNNPALGE